MDPRGRAPLSKNVAHSSVLRVAWLCLLSRERERETVTAVFLLSWRIHIQYTECEKTLRSLEPKENHTVMRSPGHPPRRGRRATPSERTPAAHQVLGAEASHSLTSRFFIHIQESPTLD